MIEKFSDYTPEQQEAVRTWVKTQEALRKAGSTASIKSSLRSMRRFINANKRAERRLCELGIHGKIFLPPEL